MKETAFALQTDKPSWGSEIGFSSAQEDEKIEFSYTFVRNILTLK